MIHHRQKSHILLLMNNHNQSESEGRPSESTPSQQLEELVKAVMLTPTQMLNLTSDDCMY